MVEIKRCSSVCQQNTFSTHAICIPFDLVSSLPSRVLYGCSSLFLFSTRNVCCAHNFTVFNWMRATRIHSVWWKAESKGERDGVQRESTQRQKLSARTYAQTNISSRIVSFWRFVSIQHHNLIYDKWRRISFKIECSVCLHTDTTTTYRIRSGDNQTEWRRRRENMQKYTFTMTTNVRNHSFILWSLLRFVQPYIHIWKKEKRKKR